MYDMDIQGTAELARAFERAPDIVVEELTAGIWESELLLERETKELTPVGVSGGTRSSIQAREPKRLADNVVGEMGSPMKHVLAVELGTKPHYPPIQPLAEWVEHKFGYSGNEARNVAFLIQRKIGRKGTEGAFMFKQAFEANQEQVLRIMARASGRAVSRIGEVN